MFDKNQFEVLSILKKSGTVSRNIPEIAMAAQLTQAEAATALEALTRAGFVNDAITAEGAQKLEGYRVKRAIIFAAGFGSRLRPITLHTPKPMVRVRGKRIIDTLLDAIVAAEIPEIIIVRGYKGGKFDTLLEKYPQIKFIDNKVFGLTNNISSAVIAGDYMQNAYICDADLILKNNNIIRKYEYQTNYLGCNVKKTDEWCLHTKKDVIQSASIGGENCCRMFGVSYWDAQDGEQLKIDVEHIFRSPLGQKLFWDEVPLKICKEHYKIAIRLCRNSDIEEIDTFEELLQVDPSYAVGVHPNLRAGRP